MGLNILAASGNWKRTKCASDFHGFEHMQIVTVECVLHGAEKCNIVAIFQIGLSGTPARNLTEEIRSPGVVPVSGNVAEYR
ncbi:hypothetical protein ACQH80_22775 [Escherichia coli]